MVASKYIVCYDIVENTIRTQISELCKDVGLERIQYSVFYGELSPDQYRALQLEAKSIIKDQSANIHFISICGSCEEKHRILLSINIHDNEEIMNKIEETEFEQKAEYEELVMIL